MEASRLSIHPLFWGSCPCDAVPANEGPSTVLMFQSIRHTTDNGPLAEHRIIEDTESPINKDEAESMPNHPLARAARERDNAAKGDNAEKPSTPSTPRSLPWEGPRMAGPRPSKAAGRRWG
jgi:hypothetical protein